MTGPAPGEVAAGAACASARAGVSSNTVPHSRANRRVANTFVVMGLTSELGAPAGAGRALIVRAAGGVPTPRRGHEAAMAQSPQRGYTGRQTFCPQVTR
jgi:hypothetical protein